MAGVNHRVSKVIKVVLDVQVLYLLPYTLQILVLPLSSQQRVKLHVSEVLEFRGVYQFDVGEG